MRLNGLKRLLSLSKVFYVLAHYTISNVDNKAVGGQHIGMAVQVSGKNNVTTYKKSKT